MIKGKTKSGFTYTISQERLNNFELLEAIGDLEENPLILPKVLKLLLGQEQTNKLKDHLRSEDGFVSTEKLSNELTEIFQNQQTKNS